MVQLLHVFFILVRCQIREAFGYCHTSRHFFALHFFTLALLWPCSSIFLAACNCIICQVCRGGSVQSICGGIAAANLAAQSALGAIWRSRFAFKNTSARSKQRYLCKPVHKCCCCATHLKRKNGRHRSICFCEMCSSW